MMHQPDRPGRRSDPAVFQGGSCRWPSACRTPTWS